MRWLIGSMVRRSGIMVLLVVVMAGLGGWGVARLPTGLHPQRGPGLHADGPCCCPDGASLERTEASLDRSPRSRKTPGVDRVVASPASILDSNNSLANAASPIIMLKDWAAGQAAGQDLRSLSSGIAQRWQVLQDGRAFRWCRRRHPGRRQCRRLPDAGRAARRLVRLRQAAERDRQPGSRPAPSPACSQPRHLVPRWRAAHPRRGRPGQGADPEGVDRRGVRRCRPISARPSSTSSTSSASPCWCSSRPTRNSATSEDILRLQVRNQDGQMVPIGALARLRQSSGRR